MAISHASESKKRKCEDADEEMSKKMAEEDHLEEANSDTGLDSDDDGEDKDENDTHEKNDYGSEKLPDQPAYDTDLEDITKKNTELIVEFEKISQAHASGSEVLQNMNMNAKARRERPKPTPPTFAVIGMRASGKSELLNQVTGLENDVMRTGNLEATTHVATVLQSPFPGQKRKYGVLIIFKTEEDCRAALEDLVAQAVNNGSFPNETEDEDTKSDCIVYGHESDDILTSLFRTRPGFENLDQTRRTLERTTKTFKGELGPDAITKDALLERMLRWLRERRESASRLYFETDYAVRDGGMDPGMTDVDTLLRGYTTGSVKKGEETYWPIVQEVRVGTTESKALELIQTADLPGQNDINPIRNNAADNYVHSCQGLWVVAEINGAVDNHALHMTVSKFAGRFPDRLLVVLTKTDIVDEGVLKRLRDDGVDMTEHDSLEENICDLQNQLTETEQQLGKRKISVKKYKQAWSQSQDLRIRLNEAEHRLYAHRVELRNDTVIGKLRQKLERYLPRNESLPMFATSAMHYRVHARTEKQRVPLMSVEMTQIPMLRKKAYEIAGPTRFRTFKRYNESMSTVFMGVRKWTEGCSSSDDAGLADIAERLHEGSHYMFAGVVEEREEIVQAKLLRLLRARRGESQLLLLLQEVRSTFTPKQDKQHWNENFLRGQTNDILDPAWHEMMAALESSLGETKDYVIKEFENTRKKMLQCQASVHSDTTAISLNFKNLQNAFSQDYETETERYKERLLTIKTYATKDSAQNFLAIALEPMYQEGFEDSGKHVVERLQALMRRWFKLKKLDDKREPFGMSHTLLEDALIEEERRYIEALQGCLINATEELSGQFALHANHTPGTPEEALARKDFKAFFDRRDSEIFDLIDRAQNFDSAGLEERR